MTNTVDVGLSESRTPSRRRWRLVLLGLLGAALVGAMPIATALRSSGARPDTKIETLPGPDLYLRATLNTERDRDYVADSSTTTASSQGTSHVVVLGSRVLGTGVFNGAELRYQIEDGRFYAWWADGWIESVLPAGRDYDPFESYSKIWPALRSGDVEELQRDDHVAVYRGTCAPGSVAGRMHWLCDRGSTITITIDIATEQVTALDATGSIPLYPGRWEQGQLHIAFGSASGAEIPPIGAVDTSKIECLARSLGIPLDRQAIAEQLRDTTTEQNRQLFAGCGYQRFPPGADFGVT